MPRPGFYFLICPDAELIKRELARLVAEHDFSGAERLVFWGDDGLGPRFWENLSLQSLFGGTKLLLVRQANLLKAEDWENLTPALARFNDQAWPVFCLETAFERGKPRLPQYITKKKFWKLAQDRGWTWQSPGATGKAMRDLLTAGARERGLKVAPKVLAAVAEALPEEGAAARRALEQMELAADDQGRVDADVAELVGAVGGLEIFPFIDSLVSGRASVEVWRTVLLSRLSSQGMLFQFLTMLVREARILWQLGVGEEVKGLPPFVLDKKRPLAKKLGSVRLLAIWDLAMQAELGVKSGERGENQALEKLVADLARALAPDRGRPGRASAR
jgi:DNA polymerase-3 subunit delta